MDQPPIYYLYTYAYLPPVAAVMAILPFPIFPRNNNISMSNRYQTGNIIIVLNYSES